MAVSLLSAQIVLLAQTQSANRPNTLGTVPLPKLGAHEIELRVAHIVNPRLPRMSDAQIALLLSSMAQVIQEHWGVKIRFNPVQTLDIQAVFQSIPSRFVQDAEKSRFDTQSIWARFKRPSLERAYAQGLSKTGEPLKDIAAFANQHGAQLDSTSFEHLGQSLVKLQLERHQVWQKLKGLDGAPSIDGKPYHEYSYWDYIGYGKLPYELILTNQLIASVEYAMPSIHSAIRGGYTNGLTPFSQAAKFSTVSIWSTAAFSENSADWLSLRAGERYTADEAARLAGISGAHELGHQLFHFLHPFDNQHCLMYPVPMFAYRAWSEKLSAQNCQISSSPEMTPGAYKFSYLRP